MSQAATDFYTGKKEKFSGELKTVTKTLHRFVWYRLFSFFLIFVPVPVLGFNNWATLALSLAAVVLYFFLVKKNVQHEKRKKKITVLLKITEDELLALQHAFSHFENGESFLNTEHFFTYDLDVFGEGSLFQFLNRTSTKSGRSKLADWLIHPSLNRNEIEKKQEAIKELAQIPEWRLQFLANGLLFDETEEISQEIENWSETELDLKNPAATKWLINLVPLLTIISLIPSATGFSNLFISIAVLSQWVLMYFYGKRIQKYFRFFGRKSDLLEKYMQLLRFIEEKKFQSEYLLELQRKVNSPDSASHIFSRLKKHVKEFEYRGNIIIGFFLNSIFLWDIRCVYKLWQWHRKNRTKLAVWLDVVAETDALISLANFANNQPHFVYPEIDDNDFTFRAKQLGHPLLQAKKRVCNDFEINGWSKVMIVTGANMAGKSTFLRTVGVNLILGRVGAPVCAGEMKFTPVKIYTNMRTTDSLLKDESYFFAELKRIKGVLDQLQNGEQIFVILDEMLKGTNSVDKLNGSKELIRKLLEFKSVSLIATHDLKLSEMEHEFPQQVFNKCFEIRIENDELVFDYLLSDGVTQTMNATFLMKKMGIIR
jgi:DNA mismatch repair ATPase MutS